MKTRLVDADGAAGPVSKARRAALLAISPVLLAAAGSAAPPGDTATAFVAPTERQILTRTLRKSLPGGAQIVARRSYEIVFVPDAAGYRVEGRMVAVDLDVPAGLEALAAIERQRGDTGLFPIRLDRSGRMIAESGEEASDATQQAATLVRTRIAGSSLSADEQRAASSFTRQLEQQGRGTQWPLDLFRPLTGHREEVREVTLPDGDQGEIVVTIDAASAGDGGLLDRVSRTVTTRLGSTTRETEEVWILRRAEANSHP